MTEPNIELIPLRGAIASDASTTLDLIVRIIPPSVKTDLKRPKLNLGLVIDRSGSMAGQKIDYARQAATYAVQQLLPTDRISVIIYDDKVKTLISNTLAENKNQIIDKIQKIRPGGSTALHDGWIEGGVQVSQKLQSEQLNRVILLSDGLANVGQTNPDIIAQDVHGLAKNGVSTSTMGIGNDYNEDLMEAIANSGDGNYYYIQSPEQLPQIFSAELQGIMATLGSKVSLGLEPKNNVEILEVFNDLEKNKYGRYKLSNLIAGNPIEVVLRLKVPAMSNPVSLCDFRLAWDDPKTGTRQIKRLSLQLPIVTSATLNEYPVNQEVTNKVALLMVARAKEEAVRHLDRGDLHSVNYCMDVALKALPTPAYGEADLFEADREELIELRKQIKEGESVKFRKAAKFQAYQSKTSRDNKKRP